MADKEREEKKEKWTNDSAPEGAPDSFKESKLRKIPYAYKAVFVKYWTCGVIYFFVNMGLTNTLFSDNVVLFSQGFDIIVLVDGLIYGLAYFFLHGFLLELAERYEGEGRPWSIYYSRKWWTIWIDILYGLVWSFLCNFFCLYLNEWMNNTPVSWMFREPFTFALLGLAVEMAFIGLKNLCVYIVHRIQGR